MSTRNVLSCEKDTRNYKITTFHIDAVLSTISPSIATTIQRLYKSQPFVCMGKMAIGRGVAESDRFDLV